MEELLYAVLLESANDASVTLALYVSGSLEAFVKAMNDIAFSLGMFNTHFVNPHGLPAEGHYSTAHDMARLLCAAMKTRLSRVFPRPINICCAEATNVPRGFLLTIIACSSPVRAWSAAKLATRSRRGGVWRRTACATG